MKKFKIHDLLEMRLNEAARNPAPFPGAWPTRMAWAVYGDRSDKDGGELRENYIGKPSAEQINRFHRLKEQMSGEKFRRSLAYCWEFDRRNLVLDSLWDGGEMIYPVVHSNLLWNAYHPWNNLEGSLQYFQKAVFLKTIGGFRVYSPLKTLPLEHVANFRLWMQQNLGKQLRSKDQRKPHHDPVDKPAKAGLKKRVQAAAKPGLGEIINGYRVYRPMPNLNWGEIPDRAAAPAPVPVREIWDDDPVERELEAMLDREARRQEEQP